MGFRRTWRNRRIRRYERKLAQLRSAAEDDSCPDTSSVYFESYSATMAAMPCTAPGIQPPSVARPLRPSASTLNDVSRFEFNRLQVELAEQLSKIRTELRAELHQTLHHLSDPPHSTPLAASPCGTVNFRATGANSANGLDRLFDPSLYEPTEQSSDMSETSEVPSPAPKHRRPMKDLSNNHAPTLKRVVYNTVVV